VLIWHYHDDDLPGPDADLTLSLKGLPSRYCAGASLTELRVDPRHANSYAAWQALGSPEAPTDEQRARLIAASKLIPVRAGVAVGVANGSATVRLSLPRTGVALIELTPATASQ